jgi:hypothetical protein
MRMRKPDGDGRCRETIQRTAIISDARIPASMRGDLHDVSGHHRYYGSSACNGGERIAETPPGPGAAGRQSLRILIGASRHSGARKRVRASAARWREPGIQK